MYFHFSMFHKKSFLVLNFVYVFVKIAADTLYQIWQQILLYKTFCLNRNKWKPWKPRKLTHQEFCRYTNCVSYEKLFSIKIHQKFNKRTVNKSVNDNHFVCYWAVVCSLLQNPDDIMECHNVLMILGKIFC